MKHIATQTPTTSCKKIRNTLLKNDTSTCSITDSHHLRFEFCLKSFKPASKPWLTAAGKSKHLAFVEQCETGTAGAKLFSDEFTFQQFMHKRKN